MASVLPRLRSRAAHGVRWRARALRRRLTQPLVTVVLPVYQVEAYVEECLTSLLQQTHRRLQVVVVDDGSTDASMDIVARVAAGDRRVTVIRQANAGLGAARNTGVRAARGTYLRFVDSDDVLPPDSTEVLVASLRRSGSDFVVGNLRRMTSTRSWVPGWAKDVHRADRIGIGLDDLPDVLKDVFAHNKMFRTDFFRAVVREFPEGVLYEDQEPTARAYVAGRFDVLSRVVYSWRIREDGSSITQQKADPVDLAHRLEVKQRVGEIIGAGASPAVAQHWRAKAVGFDLRPYFEQVPRTDLDFWEQLRRGTAHLAEQLDTRVWQQVPMVDRLLALAVLAGHRDDVGTLLTTRDDYGWQLPGVVVDGAVCLDPAYLAGLDLRPEPALLRFADADLTVASRVDAVRWRGSTLEVEGHAYLRNLDLARAPQQVAVELVCARTGEVRPVTASTRHDAAIDAESGDSWNSYAGAGFTAAVDLAATLPDPEPGTPSAEDVWRLRVRLDAGGVTSETWLTRFDRRRALASLPVGPLVAGHGRWVLQPDADLGLGVRFEPAGPDTVVSVAAGDGTATLVLADPAPDALLARCAETGVRLRAQPEPVPGGSRFRLTLPPVPAQRRAEALEWRVRAERAGASTRLFWPGSTADLDAVAPASAPVRPRCSREGTLRLVQQAWAAAVDDVALVETDEPTPQDALRIAGTLSPPGATWTAWLVGDDHRRTPAVPLDTSPDGAFTVTVPLRTEAGLAVVSGAFELELTREDADGTAETRRTAPDERLLARFPLEQAGPRRGLTWTRGSGGALRVRLRRPLRDDERGRLAQRRLHELFGEPAPATPEPWVVLETFAGKTVSDSGLALFAELRRRHPGWRYFWSLAELTTPVPEGSEPLLRHTRAWVETVRAARYLVNNANFPHYVRTGAHQTYLQTWHGTPLKKIGLDMPRRNLSLSYRAAMAREAREWDVLLAQGPFAAQVLPRALGYTGRVVTQGYPRNDALVEDGTTRKSVRHELGLDDDEHVVLYAPTWRDDVRSADGGYELVSYLDFDAAAARLGDVTFLLRGHTNTVSAGHSSAAVRDVSAHPDVNELMLAADALVTDYSSMMFDFVVTGKPVYFLVPDLERYGSTTRGFYFDLVEAAPGPVCLTDGELVDALAARHTDAGRYAERYAAFVERFAPYDDGRASRRVVDAVWGPETTTPAAADHPEGAG